LPSLLFSLKNLPQRKELKMTGTKIDEIIASIPLLDINLNDIFNFKEKCIDNLAKQIISSTLDYALETSIRRMESVSKINPRIQETAIKTVLPAVKTLAEAIRKIPECDTSSLENAPLLGLKPKKTSPKPKAEKEETKPTSVSIPEAMKEAEGTKEIGPLTEVTKVVSKRKPKGEPSGAKEARGVPPEIVEVGKQFTIGFDGQEKKYHIVAPTFFRNKNQQEADSNVTPIADNSVLAKLVTGTKKGDKIDPTIFGVAVPNSGEITSVEIREVTAPKLIFTLEGGKLIKEATARGRSTEEIDETSLADLKIPKIKREPIEL
jgi:hypothetical protein